MEEVHSVFLDENDVEFRKFQKPNVFQACFDSMDYTIYKMTFSRKIEECYWFASLVFQAQVRKIYTGIRRIFWGKTILICEMVLTLQNEFFSDCWKVPDGPNFSPKFSSILQKVELIRLFKNKNVFGKQKTTNILKENLFCWAERLKKRSRVSQNKKQAY